MDNLTVSTLGTLLSIDFLKMTLYIPVLVKACQNILSRHVSNLVVILPVEHQNGADVDLD